MSKNIRLLKSISLITHISALFIIFYLALIEFRGEVSLANGTGIMAILILGTVTALSLAVNLLVFFILSRTTEPDKRESDSMRAFESDITSGPFNLERPVEIITETGDLDDSDFSRQILKLIRSAERLDTVEKDLIRRLLENHLIDTSARKLLSEVQICTCRIIKQLSEFSRDNQPEKTEPPKVGTPV
ncbi:MAG: hypothetical protein JXA92_11460 [candidate division Zixibacteria bacterium]|nr:hypothetical protein [candidate division Zixibacteria bacterium]